MFCPHFVLYYEGISSPLVVESIKRVKNQVIVLTSGDHGDDSSKVP